MDPSVLASKVDAVEQVIQDEFQQFFCNNIEQIDAALRVLQEALPPGEDKEQPEVENRAGVAFAEVIGQFFRQGFISGLQIGLASKDDADLLNADAASTKVQ